MCKFILFNCQDIILIAFYSLKFPLLVFFGVGPYVIVIGIDVYFIISLIYFKYGVIRYLGKFCKRLGLASFSYFFFKWSGMFMI